MLKLKFVMTLAQVSFFDRVFSALARTASPEEILSIYTTDEENQRLLELAESSKSEKGLSIAEQYEFQQYRLAENYVRMAKAHAFAKMKGLAG